jgi:hypothetical protein
MSIPGSTEHGFFRRHWLLTLFLIALVLRLALLALVANQLKPDEMKTLVTDADAYTYSANHIREEFNYEIKPILTYGPGYPSFLALLSFLISPHAIFLLAVQVFLSAAGCVLVALIALQLTKHWKLAFLSGLINAISIASLSLSVIFLSETLFYVLMAGGLLLFFRGLDSGKYTPYLTAGIAFGIAILVRVMAQFFFVPLVIIAASHHLQPGRSAIGSGLRAAGLPAITIVTMLSISGLWIARNQVEYGIPTVSLAQSGGLAQLNRKVIAEVNDVDLLAARELYNQELHEHVRTELTYYVDFTGFAHDKALELLWEHPWTTLRVYAASCFGNANTNYGVILYLLPEWRHEITSIIRWLDKKGLNYLPMALAAVGVVLFLLRRRFTLLIMLLSVYVYFFLIAGFALTQGDRIFYPAQMTGAMLMAYPLLEGYEFIRRRLGRERQN